MLIAIFVDVAGTATTAAACSADDVDESFVDRPYLARSKRSPVFINEIKRTKRYN